MFGIGRSEAAGQGCAATTGVRKFRFRTRVRTPSEQGSNPQTIKALEAHVATLLSQLAAAEARLGAADAREAQHVADLVAERAQTAKAIAAFADLATRLDELAEERRRPWWRRWAG
jgi:hypothetical protein